jgi:uncharacterized protein
MRMVFAALTAVVMVTAAPAAHAEQSPNPSFDCDKAHTQDEHAICADGRLAELDQALSIAYNQAERKYRDESREVAQGALAARHSCGGDRLCILDQQVSAITTFSNLGSEVPVPPWVGSYRVELFKNRSEPPITTLPHQIGQCTITKIASISTRFGEELKPEPEDGTAVTFANGGLQISYNYEPDVAKSHIGDEVLLCLVSVPKDCPTGDDRGKIYSATNLNTVGSWLLPDAQHSCGGA